MVDKIGEMAMSSTEGPGSLDLGFPMAAQWNYMNISSHVPLDGLQMNANLVSFRCRRHVYVHVKNEKNGFFFSFDVHRRGLYVRCCHQSVGWSTSHSIIHGSLAIS